MIIISDIHGCYKSLRALINKCPQDDIIIAGDMIDRGPSSRDILHFVQDQNFDVIVGNHEDMMLNSDSDYVTWVLNGGIETLNNFVTEINGIEVSGYNLDEIDVVKKWLSSLPISLHYPNVINDDGRSLLVTHASAANVWNWSEQKKMEFKDKYRMELLWNRVVEPEDIADVYNVFGHTPQDIPVIKNHFSIIDTGCSYSTMGILTALRYPQMEVYTQENIDTSIKRAA